jgi:hypothetical protein
MHREMDLEGVSALRWTQASINFGAAALFKSGRTQDWQLQASGHLSGCVVHGGVRAAAEAFQQVADSVLYPLPGDFTNGFLRGRRDHQGSVRQCRICGFW